MNVRTRSVLEHMLEDVDDVIVFSCDINDVKEYSSDKLRRKAIIMSLLSIGELAKQLPEEFKLMHRNVSWKKIIKLRNIAAHGYRVLEDEIVWDIIKYFIPDIKAFLETQLK